VRHAALFEKASFMVIYISSLIRTRKSQRKRRIILPTKRKEKKKKKSFFTVAVGVGVAYIHALLVK
jgi:hypothetical protein